MAAEENKRSPKSKVRKKRVKSKEPGVKKLEEENKPERQSLLEHLENRQKRKN